MATTRLKLNTQMNVHMVHQKTLVILVMKETTVIQLCSYKLFTSEIVDVTPMVIQFIVDT